MAQTAANFDAMLKNFYPPIITKLMRNRVRMLKKLQKSKRPWTGKATVFPAHVGRNNSVRFQAEGSDLASAQNEVTVDWTIPRRIMSAHLRITHAVIEASKTDQGAFAQALAFETEAAVDNMMIQGNRAAWGTGTGVLAEVASISGTPPGSTVITLRTRADTFTPADINSVAANRFIRDNDVLDIWTQAGAAAWQACRVTAHSLANATITVTGGTVTTNPVAGDWIYLSQTDTSDPDAYDPMGVGGIIDDGEWIGTLFGISRTTYPITKAQVIEALASGNDAATGRAPLTIPMLQRMESRLFQAGNNPKGYEAIWSHPSVRDAYLNELTPDRRYNQAYKYDPGYKESQEDDDPHNTTINFNGHPWVAEPDAPYHAAFFTNYSCMAYYELFGFHFIEDDKGSIRRLVTGKQGLYEMQLAAYYNFGPEAWGPNQCGVLRWIDAAPELVEIV